MRKVSRKEDNVPGKVWRKEDKVPGKVWRKEDQELRKEQKKGSRRVVRSLGLRPAPCERKRWRLVSARIEETPRGLRRGVE